MRKGEGRAEACKPWGSLASPLAGAAEGPMWGGWSWLAGRLAASAGDPMRADVLAGRGGDALA